MLLDVVAAELTAPATTFSFVVPGDRVWSLRSIVAVVNTDAGGQPDRGYTLAITDGTTLVARVGADDNGTEPAELTITWADAPAGTVQAGAVATSIAPLPRLTLKPGYVITGTIVNPVGTDTWISAVAWYEYTPSAR